jgi:hypothetical protein
VERGQEEAEMSRAGLAVRVKKAVSEDSK